MEAGSLNCPNCGSTVSKDATECQYCHALLKTTACPECMGMMFVGSKFCPHCGAVAAGLAPPQATNLSCPCCDKPLQRMRVATLYVDECIFCGGIWMTVSSFEYICAIAKARRSTAVYKDIPRGQLDGQVRYLHCPQCGEMMSRMNYADSSGFIINICKEHGVWLQKDEMPHIVEFIRSGGLENPE